MLAVDRSLYNFVDSLVSNKSQNSIFNYIDDPTVMGFNLVVDFNSSDNPLFCQKTEADSAYQYLIAIGENDRAASLKEFTSRFKDVIFKFPYYLQSISGMKEIYKMDPTLGWRAKDRVLEIKTLESIDLRIGNMIDKYMNAYFDTKYYREMIPQNLRRFSCWIILSEIRNFKSYFNNIADSASVQNTQNWKPAAGKIKTGTSIRSINSMFNCYVYKMNNCEFDFSTSNEWMNELDQKNPSNFAGNSFKIKVGVIEEMHKMNFGEMTYAKDTDTANYRRAIFGVPDEIDTIDLPTILEIEDTVGGNSWLQTTIDTIKSTPAYASLIGVANPAAIEDQVRMLAMNQIRAATQMLVGDDNVFGRSSVIDIARQISNFDFNDALTRLLDDSKNPGSPGVRKNVFGSELDPILDRPIEKALGNTPGVLQKDKTSVFNAYLGNVFGHRPIAGIVNNSLNAAAQASTTGNNTIQ